MRVGDLDECGFVVVEDQAAIEIPLWIHASPARDRRLGRGECFVAIDGFSPLCARGTRGSSAVGWADINQWMHTREGRRNMARR
jgi:hypothetical protein